MAANISLITYFYETTSRIHTLIREISLILLNREQGFILNGVYLFKDGTTTSKKGS